MINAILTSAALWGTTALALGQAKVYNACSYSVSLSNVPASGGGYSIINQQLAPGGTYSQEWTQLSNTMGWSLKLYKGTDTNNILQYEYTCHEDGTIWYDLSEVNGNPWANEGWMITATPGCSPRQAAYRHPTDDAYGMQDCPDSSDITVTLCADSSSGAAPAPGKLHQPKPPPAPSAPTGNWDAPPDANKVVDTGALPAAGGKQPPKQPGKPHGKPDSYRDPNAVYVTSVQTVHVQTTVTAGAPQKRHTHHARHPYNRR